MFSPLGCFWSRCLITGTESQCFQLFWVCIYPVSDFTVCLTFWKTPQQWPRFTLWQGVGFQLFLTSDHCVTTSAPPLNVFTITVDVKWSPTVVLIFLSQAIDVFEHLWVRLLLIFLQFHWRKKKENSFVIKKLDYLFITELKDFVVCMVESCWMHRMKRQMSSPFDSFKDSLVYLFLMCLCACVSL